MSYRPSWGILGAVVITIAAASACSDSGSRSSDTPPDTGDTPSTPDNNSPAPNNATDEPGEGSLRAGNDLARSCEVMIIDTNKNLTEVLFADLVEGRSMRRGGYLAVSFFVKDDTAIPPGAVSFETTGPTDEVAITQSRCFDQLGAVLADSAVSLEL